MKRFFRPLFTILLLAAVFYYVGMQPEMLAALENVDAFHVAVIACIGLFYLLTNSLILKMLLNAFNVPVSLPECLSISSFGAMGNYISFFGGGTFGKAVYLKNKYDFSYSAFASAIFAIGLIELILASIMGVAALHAQGGAATAPQSFLLLFFAVSAAAAGIFFFFPADFVRGRGRIVQIAGKVADGWVRLKGKPRLLSGIAFLLMLNHCLHAAEIFFCYKALSIDLPVRAALVIAVTGNFANFVRLTPASIGVYEGLVASSSELLGAGFAEGLAAGGVARIVYMAVVVTVFGLSMLLSWGRPAGGRE